MNFQATAFNEKGDRFTFFFSNPNWHTIDDIAKVKLEQIIADDEFHQSNGPWNYKNIDVSG